MRFCFTHTPNAGEGESVRESLSRDDRRLDRTVRCIVWHCEHFPSAPPGHRKQTQWVPKESLFKFWCLVSPREKLFVAFDKSTILECFYGCDIEKHFQSVPSSLNVPGESQFGWHGWESPAIVGQQRTARISGSWTSLQVGSVPVSVSCPAIP